MVSFFLCGSYLIQFSEIKKDKSKYANKEAILHDFVKIIHASLSSSFLQNTIEVSCVSAVLPG